MKHKCTAIIIEFERTRQILQKHFLANVLKFEWKDILQQLIIEVKIDANFAR